MSFALSLAVAVSGLSSMSKRNTKRIPVSLRKQKNTCCVSRTSHTFLQPLEISGLTAIGQRWRLGSTFVQEMDDFHIEIGRLLALERAFRHNDRRALRAMASVATRDTTPKRTHRTTHRNPKVFLLRRRPIPLSVSRRVLVEERRHAVARSRVRAARGTSERECVSRRGSPKIPLTSNSTTQTRRRAGLSDRAEQQRA